MDSDNPAIKCFIDNLPKTADGMTAREALEKAVTEADGEALGEFISSAIGGIVEGGTRLSSEYNREFALFPIFVRGERPSHFKVGYIESGGAVVIGPTFDEGTRFYEGLASVKTRNRWGLINLLGEFIIEPRFESRCRFREGLAVVTAKGKRGVIDRSGNFVVQPKYDYLEPFRGGRAVFRIGKFNTRQRWRYGNLDKEGVEVIPAVFHNAYGFSEGLAAVRVADLWGYIDASGIFKITPRFGATRHGFARIEDTECGYFVSGRAPVWTGDGYGYADIAGNWGY